MKVFDQNGEKCKNHSNGIYANICTICSIPLCEECIKSHNKDHKIMKIEECKKILSLDKRLGKGIRHILREEPENIDDIIKVLQEGIKSEDSVRKEEEKRMTTVDEAYKIATDENQTLANRLRMAEEITYNTQLIRLLNIRGLLIRGIPKEDLTESPNSKFNQEVEQVLRSYHIRREQEIMFKELELNEKLNKHKDLDTEITNQKNDFEERHKQMMMDEESFKKHLVDIGKDKVNKFENLKVEVKILKDTKMQLEKDVKKLEEEISKFNVVKANSIKTLEKQKEITEDLMKKSIGQINFVKDIHTKLDEFKGLYTYFSQYKGIKQKLNDQIKKLEERENLLKNNVQGLMDKLSLNVDLLIKNKELESKKAALNNEIKALESQKEVATAELNTYKDKEEFKEFKKFDEERIVQKKELELRNEELKSLCEKIRNESKNLEKTTNYLRTLEEERTKIEKENKERADKEKQLRENIIIHQGNADEFKKNEITEKAKFDKVAKEYSDKKEELKRLEAEINKFNEEKSKWEREVKVREIKISDLESQSKKLRDGIINLKEKMVKFYESCDNKVAPLKEKINNISEKLLKAKGQFGSYQRKLEERKVNIGKIQKTFINSLKQNFGNIRKAFEAEIKKYKEGLNGIKGIFEKFKKKVSEFHKVGQTISHIKFRYDKQLDGYLTALFKSGFKSDLIEVYDINYSEHIHEKLLETLYKNMVGVVVLRFRIANNDTIAYSKLKELHGKSTQSFSKFKALQFYLQYFDDSQPELVDNENIGYVPPIYRKFLSNKN